MILGRRSLVTGLLGLIAAPAIVRASSLMACTPTETLAFGGITEYWGGRTHQIPRTNSLLTIDMISRDAVKLLNTQNLFLQEIHEDYDTCFAADGAKVGTQLRIRLPNDYVITDGPRLDVAYGTKQIGPRWSLVTSDNALPPAVPAAAAVALGAVALVARNPTVSRRFWERK